MSDVPILPAVQFFGYMESGAIECPGCGHVVVLSKRLPRSTWHHGPGRFCCPHCRCKGLLGVIFWPIPHGPGSAGEADAWPKDKIPTPAQAQEMRAQFGARSVVSRQRAKRGDRTNAAASAQCTCPRSEFGHAILIQADCPVHKGQSLKVDPSLKAVNTPKGPHAK